MEFTRFTWAMVTTLLASGLWIAQLATSFPLIRWGCVFILLSYFLAIAIDAFIDKAKDDAQGLGNELLTVIAPHIGYAAGLLFLVIVGVFVGW